MDVSLEMLFERFRTSGDPDALAAIYDRVAVQLLRLAIHMTRDQAQSEDLLQATFVAAIESAPAFDAGRPLLPWLMGILAKQAHKARAEQRREAAATHAEPPAIDPRTEAEVEELSRALDGAIERLPEVLRSVLVLKLKHGLTPGEIANALNRSPGTVRVQLHRGLEQLRGLLPAGFALSALLVVTPARGLAAVREAVLATLPAKVAPVIALAGVGGVLAMKKLVLSVAAVTVVVVLGYMMVVPREAGGSPDPAGTELAAANATPRTPGNVDTGVTPADDPPLGTRRAAANEPPSSAPSAFAVIKGRCVAAESGVPLTTGRVQLYGHVTREARSSASAPAPWARPEPVSLDHEGRFIFSFIPPPDRDYSLTIDPVHRVSRRGFLKRLDPGSVTDFGELRFVAGSSVRGTIREEDGNPVSGVRITVKYASQRLVDGSTEQDTAQAATDDGGRFTLYGCLPPGSYALDLPPECSLVSPPRLVVPADTPEIVADITVRLAPIAGKVLGIVLDDAGHPLTGATVNVMRIGIMPVPIGHVRTGADGKFELACRGLGLDRVKVQASSQDLLDPQPDREVRLGEPVTIRMARVLGLRIAVCAADTTEPIDEFEVFLEPREPRRTMSLGPKHVKRHAGGVVVVADEPPGDYVLLIAPKDRKRWRPSRRLPVEIRAGEATSVTVDLRSPVELTVVVRFGSGAPVPGSRVQLIRPGTFASWIEQMEEIGMEGRVWTSGGGERTPEPTVVLDAAETDARGEVRLGAVPDEPEHVIRALGPGHVPVVQRGISIVRGAPPIEITVHRGASLEGRLTPIAVLAQLDGLKATREQLAARSPTQATAYERMRPGLALRRVGETNPDRWLPNDSTAFGADEKGVVRAAGLAVGRFEVFLRWWNERSHKTHSPAPIAVVTLEEDRASSFDADIGALAPGALTGVVQLDGKPLATTELTLQPGGPSTKTDAEGRFAFPGVRGGRYRASIDAKNQAMGSLLSDEEVEVEGGKALQVTFHLRARALRLRVLAPDGKPAAGAKLALIREPSSAGCLVAANNEGMVVLPMVPHGRIAVKLVPPEAEGKVQQTQWGGIGNIVTGHVGLLRAVGAVDVPISETEVSATIRLP